MTNHADKLLEFYTALGVEDRKTLIAFAGFLSSRAGTAPSSGAPMEQEVLHPEFHPGPEDETVINAIQRLSSIYHMLDKVALFHETSTLMSEHVMKGRPGAEVIEELEALFKRQYEIHTGSDRD